MIWIESPSNPLLKLVDLEAVSAAAKGRDILVVCDNTFATPYLQRPLELGCDIVMHSATKFLNGHSDMVGGILATADSGLAERLAYLQNSIGAVAGPFDSFLALRGLKTLDVRMERHCRSAAVIAEWLENDSRVERVLYPGLASHPQHELARRQMSDFGGIVTFFIKGDLADARRFLERCEVFSLAESLGGVESLVDHPAIMTHASVPEKERAKLGICGSAHPSVRRHRSARRPDRRSRSRAGLSANPVARDMRAWKTAGVAALLVAVLAISMYATRDTGREDAAPPLPAAADFVGRDQCAECHAEAYRQVARLGSRQRHGRGERLRRCSVISMARNSTHAGVTSRFYRRDDGFFVSTEGPDGETGEFEVRYTFGIEPLQQYLVPFPAAACRHCPSPGIRNGSAGSP